MIDVYNLIISIFNSFEYLFFMDSTGSSFGPLIYITTFLVSILIWRFLKKCLT